MEFSEKHHWLFTINQLTNSYKCAFELLIDGKEENDKKRGLVLTSYMNIQLYSLLREWSYKFIDRSVTDITMFKIRLQPLIDELHSFKDVRYARNKIFAHNRDLTDENKNTLLSDKIASLSIPVDINDLVFCAYLIDMLNMELQCEFETDFTFIKENSTNEKSINARFKNLAELITAKNDVYLKIKRKSIDIQLVGNV